MELFVQFHPGLSQITNRLSRRALKNAIEFASDQGLVVRTGKLPKGYRGLIAKIDGKCLISKNFLLRASDALSNSPSNTVVFPEFRVFNNDQNTLISRFPELKDLNEVIKLNTHGLIFPDTFVCTATTLKKIADKGRWEKVAFRKNIEFVPITGTAEFSQMPTAALLSSQLKLKFYSSPKRLNIVPSSLKELFREIIYIESVDIRMSPGIYPVQKKSYIKFESKVGGQRGN